MLFFLYIDFSIIYPKSFPILACQCNGGMSFPVRMVNEPQIKKSELCPGGKNLWEEERERKAQLFLDINSQAAVAQG